MSLLGVDVGTSGCKAIAFGEDDGRVIASAYREYDIRRPRPGWAELDALEVWGKVKAVLGEVAAATRRDPVRALAVSSLGEATVPVSTDRRVLGPSILMDDVRGAEYLPELGKALTPSRLFHINGNTLGNHYGLTKILWTRDHQREVYDGAHKFLLWGSFVSYMLGADPVVDYSLANRTLLIDIHKGQWSDELLQAAGLNVEKLPATAPSGTPIGTIAASVADEIGLPRDVTIAAGAHDQCANALGCGVTSEGRAMLGMGTYICLTPAYPTPPPAEAMMARGLNTEHHAVPGLFVSFIYNHGGSMLKWYRDTFARAEHQAASTAGRSVYPELLSEMPDHPSRVIALPHFAPTGPPEFVGDSCGVLAGLKLETSRGEIVKGILEGVVFYVRACVETLPEAGIRIDSVRAVGGGSRSDARVQLSADILGCPFVRPEQTEAGALGAAIMAGAGAGVYGSLVEGAERVVRLERSFEPDTARHEIYNRRFAHYMKLWPLMKDYLRAIAADELG